MTDENEIQDSELDSEATDTETTEDESTEQETTQDDSELVQKNKQLFERAKKAEEEAKRLKAELATKSAIKPDTTSTVTEEVVLLLKEYDLEDFNVLKTVQAGSKALGKEMSLAEARETVVFQAYIKDKKEKEKSKSAQLSASTKSLSNKLKTQNLSREEHKKLFEESLK